MKRVGNYTTSKKLGSGSFGDVYLAHDSTPERNAFAIKSIKKSLLKKTKHQELLESEIHLLNILDHPNVLKLVEYTSDNNHHYLVLSYCANGDLNNYIKSKVGMTEDDAFPYMAQMLNAFKYLKDRKVIHRDVKPENFFMNHNFETIIVGDLGFAKSGIEETNTQLGTPSTIAPEIIKGQAYSSKVDIFSLGITFYFMITAEDLFKGGMGSIGRKILEKCGKNLVRPDTCNSGNILSDQFLDLLSKMTEVEPISRITIEECFLHPFFQNQLDKASTSLSPLKQTYINEFRQNVLIVKDFADQNNKPLVKESFLFLDDKQFDVRTLYAREYFFNERSKVWYMMITAKKFCALGQQNQNKKQNFLKFEEEKTNQKSKQNFLKIAHLLTRKALMNLKINDTLIAEQSAIEQIKHLNVFYSDPVSNSVRETFLVCINMFKEFLNIIHNLLIKSGVPEKSIYKVSDKDNLEEINDQLKSYYNEERLKLVSDSEEMEREKVIVSCLVELYRCTISDKFFVMKEDKMFDWDKLRQSDLDIKKKMVLLSYLVLI